jgi:hypothetical protein
LGDFEDLMDIKLTALKDKLFSGKEANQLPAIAELVSFELNSGENLAEEGLQILDEFIQARKAAHQEANTEPTWIDGKIHQTLISQGRSPWLKFIILKAWSHYDLKKRSIINQFKFY